MRVPFVALCFIFALWLMCKILMLLAVISVGLIGLAFILTMILFIFQLERSR